METTQQTGHSKTIAPEFSTYELSEAQKEAVNKTRWMFNNLLDYVSSRTSPDNARYVSLVKTKLEEACMFAIKGISKN